eukprot:TRINITY_DN35080_c0_g1_i2.p1 TRINITY_DN35080_c0_g1~~TRINITY_DN35080_c0_g1_i2.p1  ORF type:complete len:670 (+),score=117.78 TRINITY_DN35080_c0_g1_i2:176-2185(+)
MVGYLSNTRLLATLARVDLCLIILSLFSMLGSCYIMWLSAGCTPFMPFISDLGIHGTMKTTFNVGMAIIGFLEFFAVLFTRQARDFLIQWLKMENYWGMLNSILTLLGMAVVGGHILIGSFPWDQSGWTVYFHFLCADAVFYGGCFWGLFSGILALRFGWAEGMQEDKWASLRRLQLPVAVGAGTVFLMGGICLALAHDLQSTFFGRWSWWDETQAMARDDFASYCRGETGWHSMFWVNCVAVTEWVVSLLMLSAVGLAFVDIDTYCRWSSGERPGATPGGGARKNGTEKATLAATECTSALCGEPLQLRTKEVARWALCCACCSRCCWVSLSVSMWLWRGCSFFMPFVSDLYISGSMAVISTMGTLVDCLALSVWLIYYEAARRQLCLTAGVLQQAEFCRWASGFLGALMMSCTLLAALAPWDRHFFFHFYCYGVVWFCGCAWPFMNFVLSWQTWSEAPHWSRSWRTWLVLPGISCCLVVFSVGCLVFCLFMAPLGDAEGHFRYGWWIKAQALARDNFLDFCTGTVGIHSSPWVNLAASAEWAFTALVMLCTFFFHLDVELAWHGVELEKQDGSPAVEKQSIGKKQADDEEELWPLADEETPRPRRGGTGGVAPGLERELEKDLEMYEMVLYAAKSSFWDHPPRRRLICTTAVVCCGLLGSAFVFRAH